jgi:hypothetical protein
VPNRSRTTGHRNSGGNRSSRHNLLGGTWYYDDEPFGQWMRDLQGFIPAAGTQATLEVDLGTWAAATAKAGTTGEAAEATTNLHGRGRRDPTRARG